MNIGSERRKMEGLKEKNWSVLGYECGQSKRFEVNGPKVSKWTAQKD